MTSCFGYFDTEGLLSCLAAFRDPHHSLPSLYTTLAVSTIRARPRPRVLISRLGAPPIASLCVLLPCSARASAVSSLLYRVQYRTVHSHTPFAKRARVAAPALCVCRCTMCEERYSPYAGGSGADPPLCRGGARTDVCVVVRRSIACSLCHSARCARWGATEMLVCICHDCCARSHKPTTIVTTNQGRASHVQALAKASLGCLLCLCIALPLLLPSDRQALAARPRAPSRCDLVQACPHTATTIATMRSATRFRVAAAA